uniref:Large ribosomal subunit protein bL19 n=1 Tax=Chlorobium chlorochromatii (strain CaD3) TaxID=340177 RepID=RL19_CHLCH|nr:RecName: Full=Large ribosomal subunit protein bL19; AltName: Full=50S ribosomal protein L19 [Chlorobium chlorochromatii CaD3]
MNQLIQLVESSLGANRFEQVRPGDTVKIQLRVIEGEKERLQAFEGVVISDRGEGGSKTITVRKISHGVGVERIIPVNSPNIESVTVLRHGRARRAKLFYLRKRTGKAALKVKERKTQVNA